MFRKIFISFLALVMLFIPLNSYSESGKSIVLKINSKTAFVNFQPVTLDVAPIEIKGRTLVPLRFISEHFGAKKISYFADTQEIALELDDPVVLRDENTKLLDKNKTLENENIGLKSENSNLKNENESLKSKIRDLENQKTPNPQIQLPTAPLDLQGYVSNKQVILSWRASNQGTYPIVGYKIYRTEQGTNNFVNVAVLPSTALTYTDTQVNEGKGYIYFVKASDSGYPSNESAESNKITIQIPNTQQPPPPPPSPPPPSNEWQLQYTFDDQGYPHNLMHVYIKEDIGNFHFRFTTYRSWGESNNLIFGLYVDVDKNINTGWVLSSGTKTGYDIQVVFSKIKSEPYYAIAIYNNNTNEFDIKKVFNRTQFTFDDGSLTIAIPKEYFSWSRTFDYSMIIVYDNDKFKSEYYPSTFNLTYPKPIPFNKIFSYSATFYDYRPRSNCLGIVLKNMIKTIKDKKTPDPAYYAKFV